MISVSDADMKKPPWPQIICLKFEKNAAYCVYEQKIIGIFLVCMSNCY